MLTVIIIDDEPDARATLRHFLESYCPDVQIVGEAGDVPSGVALIRSLEPQVVLLDIQIGAATGFDLLDNFANPAFGVVFTTAYDQYAVKAFKYAALDYLLKPIDPTELIKAIDRAKANLKRELIFRRQLEEAMHGHRSKIFEKLALPSAEGLIFVKLNEILYLKSDVNYTFFYTTGNEKYLVSKPLKEYEELLPQDQFCRPHQSYILNVRLVRKMLKEDGGYALMENGHKIPVSRRKKDLLLRMLMD